MKNVFKKENLSVFGLDLNNVIEWSNAEKVDQQQSPSCSINAHSPHRYGQEKNWMKSTTAKQTQPRVITHNILKQICSLSSLIIDIQFQNPGAILHVSK